VYNSVIVVNGGLSYFSTEMSRAFLVDDNRWKGRDKKQLKVASLKVVHSSVWETHRRATERHLPYGFAQGYLPPDTGERAPPLP